MNRLAFLSTAALLTASGAVAQQQPPIRPLGPVVATSTETFAWVGERPMVFVRHVKNGVLVNDAVGRRVLMFDPALSKFTVVADSTPATASAYGRSGNLIAYRGDSSLFIDAQSTSMLVIDETGKVGRVMAIPRAQDAAVFANATYGAAFHPSGRIVYRPIPRPDPVAMRQAMAAMGVGGGGGSGQAPPATPTAPDSAAVLAVDLQSRQIDTLGWNKVPRLRMDIQRTENGVMARSIANPLPTVDDWAIMSDGSIALVRGRDYHIDWVRPDGSRESSPKIPFDWRRLSDEDKVALIDSVRAQRERMQTQMLASGGGGPMIVGGGGGGGETRTIVMGPGGAGGPPAGDRGGRQPGAAGGGAPGAGMAAPQVLMVEPSELPDYQPVFFAGSSRADADGRLWVRTIPTKNLPGGPVYDVINLKGELIDRVQVPQDRTIIGFGPGGIVYLAARDGTKTKIEKASFK